MGLCDCGAGQGAPGHGRRQGGTRLDWAIGEMGELGGGWECR